MVSVSQAVYECVSSAKMRKSINEAYEALFEGLRPPQKTRRAIRQLLPEPPGGWDSPALDASGRPLLTSEHSREMSYAECLEYNIRNMFFHDGGRSEPKFEPGVARIAYEELGIWPVGLPDWRGGSRTPDWGKAKELSAILRNITTSHADDYDFDLNGMTFDELADRFARGSSDTGAVNEEADGSGCRYNVTWIPDFRTARQYAKYTEGTQTWCLTEDRSQWNRYMKGNTVKMYICTRPGFEDVPGVPGENCPLDEYGLSMLGVSVNPDGSLDTCCTRWNHLHGGSDMAMDEAELCKVLNVRKLSDVCPPYTKEEIEERGRGPMEQAMRLIRDSDSWNGKQWAVLDKVFKLPGITMWKVCISGTWRYVPVDEEANPVVRYPLTSFEVIGNSTLVGYYNEYGFDGVDDADTEGGDIEISDYDPDEDSVLIYSSISGKTHYLDEHGTTATRGDLDIDDAIGYDIMENTYDFRPGQVIRGIALTMHAAFEGVYLFDAVKMDFVGDSSDGFVDTRTGNMFSKDNCVFLVTRDGVVNYGDRLAKMVDPEYPRRSPTGRIRKWNAWMWTCSTYPTVGVSVNEGATSTLFIVDPLSGKVIRKVEGLTNVAAARKSSESNYEEKLILTFDDGQKGLIRLDGKMLELT